MHSCYSVPVVLDSQTGRHLVNWRLVERAIDYVRDRIAELRMPTERHVVVSKYNLEEYSKRDPQRMVTRVWDNKFQGNRHVVVDSNSSHSSWLKPLDLT